MIKINGNCLWSNSRKWSIHIFFHFRWPIVQKTWRFWWKYQHYQRPSRCQKSKPAKPLLWNQKLIQEENVGSKRMRCHTNNFFRNLIAMMYRKTRKWINTIRYTNKNRNNINTITNKRMKTKFAWCDLTENLAAFEHHKVVLTSVSGYKICRKLLCAISL